jgi:type I restriction enzyme S subunit
MADWRTSTWGDEVTLEYGKALRGYSSESGRYRVFGSNGQVGWTDEPLVDGPGIILGRKGAYRGVQYCPDPFFVIDTAYYVRPKTDLDMRWLYYAIKFHKLGEIDDGSPIPSTTRSAVYVRELEVPPLNEQRQMASVLAALDDKIELNRKTNETLESMALAIFKDWRSLSSTDVLRQSVAELTKAGILAIGDGYRAKNNELFAPGLPFIRAGELNNGFDTGGADILNESSVATAGEKRSRPGDVAFTSKGTIGRFARVTSATPEFVYSPQVCFWRSLAPDKLRPSILYVWMVSSDLRSQIDAVSGQTDMAPYVSLKDQRMMTVPVFPEDQHRIADTLDTLLDLQANNAAESQTLAATRDLLLPKLMSGEIHIRDTEAMVADAA